MPDAQIARLLNRCGKPTGYGNGWTQQRVRGLRSHHEIAVYRDGIVGSGNSYDAATFRANSSSFLHETRTPAIRPSWRSAAGGP
jgi:hypothetical protein